MKRLLSVPGISPIDARTTVGRALGQWRTELVADLGGEQAVSAAQRTLVDLCVTTRLLLSAADSFMLGEMQGALINRRRRSFYPMVLQRAKLADSLSRYLGQLGLERRARPVTDLARAFRELAGEKREPPREGSKADESLQKQTAVESQGSAEAETEPENPFAAVPDPGSLDDTGGSK